MQDTSGLQNQLIMLKLVVENLKNTYGLTPNQALMLLGNNSEFVPLSIFNSKITVLGSIVLYLHDKKNLGYAQIARLLNRKPRSIWATYKIAKKENLEITDDFSKGQIPLEIFNGKMTPSEAIIFHLSNLGWNTKKIADFLRRDSKSIMALRQRAKRK